jgi:prephenate dehydrogenase
LSNHILSCHPILGNLAPGVQSRVVIINSKEIATKKGIFELFFDNIVAMYKTGMKEL